jgi:uncharacterized phiE125 gp8 family phage protein
LAEPVTIAEARAQVNIIDAADTTFDTFLTSLLAPARAYVERESRFFLVAATRSEVFNSWGGDRSWHSSHCGQDQFLEIYRRPLASIGSITYTDEAGNAGTAYTGFLTSLDSFPARISPAINDTFPSLGRGGEIVVTYTSGALGSTAEEYLLLKRAILLLVGHWFANRESVVSDTRAVAIEVPQTVTDLIDAVRPLSAY